MLLDRLNSGARPEELLHLIEDPVALNDKVAEALEVLEAHAMEAQAQDVLKEADVDGEHPCRVADRSRDHRRSSGLGDDIRSASGGRMKRIQVVYDGLQYSIGQEDYEQLKGRIEEIIGSGQPGWIRVNQGEGTPRDADLLITPASSIALIAVDGSGF